MILGVDHIALNVAHTEFAKKNLEAKGYTCAFMEYNVPNDPSKKILLKQYQSLHSLAVFRSPQRGNSIEITNHGLIAQNNPPYNYTQNFIELYTANLNVEKEFWISVFQFKEQADNILSFSSPIPSWSCTLKIIEKKDQPCSSLDDEGYTCLAFLTNDLDNDTQIAKAAGAWDIISPFKIIVNRRQLSVIMFRTPGGAICELIKIMK